MSTAVEFASHSLGLPVGEAMARPPHVWTNNPYAPPGLGAYYPHENHRERVPLPGPSSLFAAAECFLCQAQMWPLTKCVCHIRLTYIYFQLCLVCGVDQPFATLAQMRLFTSAHKTLMTKHEGLVLRSLTGQTWLHVRDACLLLSQLLQYQPIDLRNSILQRRPKMKEYTGVADQGHADEPGSNASSTPRHRRTGLDPPK